MTIWTTRKRLREKIQPRAKLELLTKSIYYAKAGKHNGGIDEAAMLQKRK